MSIKEIVCGLVGHVPSTRPRKHKWHLFCSRCNKELVAHNPEPKVAPYKVEPDPIALAKLVTGGEGERKDEEVK